MSHLVFVLVLCASSHTNRWTLWINLMLSEPVKATILVTLICWQIKKLTNVWPQNPLKVHMKDIYFFHIGMTLSSDSSFSVYLTIHSNCFLFLPPHRQMDALNSSRKWLHDHPVGRSYSVGQNLLAWDHPYSHWVSYLIEYISLTWYQHSHSHYKSFFFSGKNQSVI